MPKDFSRDLGYLDKFFIALRSHAATLGEPAGSRLNMLLDEQEQAWAEIRGLLRGEIGTSAGHVPSSAPVGAGETAAETQAPPVASHGATGEAMPKRLTVGSLIS